jgi:hypothetical protein
MIEPLALCSAVVTTEPSEPAASAPPVRPGSGPERGTGHEDDCNDHDPRKAPSTQALQNTPSLKA